MENYIKNNLIAISIIFIGILISVSILVVFGFKLDVVEKLFSIIGSFSLLIAIFTYFSKKKQDETLAAIDQVLFFREKVILEWDKVSKWIKSKQPKYSFSRIILNDYHIENMRGLF